MFSNHPFVQNNSHQFQILPPQMLTIQEKDEKWQMQCMDALEYIARIQWLTNQKLLDNYKLVNGEFIPSEYGIEDEYKDPLSQITTDFNVPSFIKNYDIISQPINRLVGEIDLQPDIFTIVGKGELIEGEMMRTKTEMIREYQMADIEKKIKLKLIDKGLDPDFNEFETEEEQQQYLQQIEQESQKLRNPMQIQNWIDREYKHMAVQWAEIELEDQKERFNLADLRRTEFRDLLTTGRRFRHIYLKANGFGIESWNPVNTFYHKSPEVKFIQDGDYVGRIHVISIPDIIDRYGFRMTGKQLSDLQAAYTKTYQEQSLAKTTMDGKPIDYLSPSGIPYATRVPSLDRFINDFAPQVKDFPATSTWFLSEANLDAINGGGAFLNAINGMYQVTEGYWKSAKRIGKLTWINPETQLLEKILIDDNFIIPKYVKEIDGTIEFKEEDEINSVSWTWINEIWSGVKIANAGTHSNLAKPIYLDVQRHDVQFKGETLIYEPKLPVAGQVLNNRNAVSAGLVDLMKPFQFFHNVLMNQAYQFLEKEIMPFILMDVNLIPNDKDWGSGKNKNLEKWMEVAKAWGIVPADTSPENTAGANVNGGQLPRVIDLDMSQRIMTRLNMAQQIKALALDQVGISPQRLGDVKASETATGINQATQNSSIQTSYWFTEFFACERDILKMQLAIAQTLQARNKDILATATKSDLSNSFLKFTDNDFMLYDLHVYISNSQKTVRDLEMVRRLGIENNTLMTKMSDRITMATSNSIPSIVEIIKRSEKENEERQSQEQQMRQQQMEQSKEIADAQLAQEKEQFYAKLENDLSKEYIRASGFNENLSSDANSNTIPDVLEQLKFIENQGVNSTKMSMAQQKLDLDREMSRADRNFQERQLTFKEQQEANKLKLEKEKLKRAKVQGDKSK